jgi:hypothetical protein
MISFMGRIYKGPPLETLLFPFQCHLYQVLFRLSNYPMTATLHVQKQQAVNDPNKI